MHAINQACKTEAQRKIKGRASNSPTNCPHKLLIAGTGLMTDAFGLVRMRQHVELQVSVPKGMQLAIRLDSSLLKSFQDHLIEGLELGCKTIGLGMRSVPRHSVAACNSSSTDLDVS